MSKERLPLSIYLLSICNAYLYICASLLITVSALIGFVLAPDKRLATLPMALQFFSIMCGSVPASLIMGKLGRKVGFLIGGAIGVVGAVLALWSVLNEIFVGFCFATICFGLFAAFGNYYRFTAAELVPSSGKSQAIAMVMAGGVIAAFIGPNLANWSSQWFEASIYAGPFLALIAVYLLSMATIAFAALPGKLVLSPNDKGRTTGTILRQPIFIIAVLCQMIGYGTMNLVMTATPLAMHHDHLDMDATAFVIQWHVLAMFAPSFVTGHLIKRIGIVAVLLSGVALGLACVVINLHGHSMVHYTASLILLGISWNFLYIGGTWLLTETHSDAEKSRTQAANDFLVFSTVTATALAAGTMHHVFGYQLINMAIVPLLIVVGVAVLYLPYYRQRVSQVTMA